MVFVYNIPDHVLVFGLFFKEGRKPVQPGKKPVNAKAITQKNKPRVASAPGFKGGIRGCTEGGIEANIGGRRVLSALCRPCSPI